LALLAGLAAAQGPEPPAVAVSAEGTAGAAAVVAGVIPIQGRLTDASGRPLNRDYSIKASVYDVATGGTARCSRTDTVPVNNGLFDMRIYNCTAAHINGDQLYLGIKVGSDPEMTPRQAIYPVPYAWSLKPGAIVRGAVSGSPNSVIRAENTAVVGAAYGVVGQSASTDGIGVYGIATASGGVGGVFSNTHADGVALIVDGSGIIRSTAKSYLWISGNGLRPYRQSDSTIIDMDTIGGAKIYRGATAGNKNVMLPITVPGPLYGQNVTVSGLDIYWVGDTTSDRITAVRMVRQIHVCSTPPSSCYAEILHDDTARSCADSTNPTGCTLSFPSAELDNNVLTAESGILYLTLELTFFSDSTWVEIGGVRLTLEHN
jgi:hypothetical protein